MNRLHPFADPLIFQDTTVYHFDTLLTRLREQAFLNAGAGRRIPYIRFHRIYRLHEGW